MLKVLIPASEQYDAKTETFSTTKEQVLQLEHSLVSLSKWESKYGKPFLTREARTTEESIDYIRCMTLTQNVDSDVYKAITDDILKQVAEYIDAPMTATTFPKDGKRGGNAEIATAEIIYYWMVSNNIPFECQKWHLNRLLTLINVCHVKSQPPKKMKNSELIERNRALNHARRKRLNTRG